MRYEAELEAQTLALEAFTAERESVRTAFEETASRASALAAEVVTLEQQALHLTSDNSALRREAEAATNKAQRLERQLQHMTKQYKSQREQVAAAQQQRSEAVSRLKAAEARLRKAGLQDGTGSELQPPPGPAAAHCASDPADDGASSTHSDALSGAPTASAEAPLASDASRPHTSRTEAHGGGGGADAAAQQHVLHLQQLLEQQTRALELALQQKGELEQVLRRGELSSTGHLQASREAPSNMLPGAAASVRDQAVQCLVGPAPDDALTSTAAAVPQVSSGISGPLLEAAAAAAAAASEVGDANVTMPSQPTQLSPLTAVLSAIGRRLPQAHAQELGQIAESEVKALSAIGTLMDQLEASWQETMAGLDTASRENQRLKSENGALRAKLERQTTRVAKLMQVDLDSDADGSPAVGATPNSGTPPARRSIFKRMFGRRGGPKQQS